MKKTHALIAALAALTAAGCPQGGAEPTPELLDARRELDGALPAYPGAEGFGTDTPAGRGGAVLRVTNLDPQGPGSFRAAAEAEGPRTVVFEVGGVIELEREIVIRHPFCTIAGQTAPSPGVTLIGAGLVVQTHDVLVQHLRVRPGDRERGPRPSGRDGVSVIGAPDGSADTYGVVIAHCSVSWAIDEGTSTWYEGVRDVTFRNCLIAENLAESLHPKGEHSKGLLIGDHAKRVAVIGNLFAHNRRRNPLIKGDVSALVANNYIYDCGNGCIHLDDPEGSQASLASVVNNVLKPGPSTPQRMAMIYGGWNMKTRTRIDGFGNDASGKPVWRSARGQQFSPVDRYQQCAVQVSPLTLRETVDVPGWVLRKAGARPADRDPVDERIIHNVRTGDGRIIDSVAEAGGFPDPEPHTRKLELPSDPHGDDDSDGYTNLEEWLHAMAAEVGG